MEIYFYRASLALGIIATGLVAYWLLLRYLLARVKAGRKGLEDLAHGVPAILYFTSSGCLPCHRVQRPELARLEALLRDQYQLIQVDCSQQPDLAEYWGVLSVPTTFIFDSRGRPRHVNHGVMRACDLWHQLERVEGHKFDVPQSDQGAALRKA